MTDPNEAWVVARAEEYFRELEQLLLDLGFVRSRFRAAMKRVAGEYRREVQGVRLILYAKVKPPNPEVTALYWSQICRLPKLKRGARKNPKFRRWVRHMPGELTNKQIYFAGAYDFHQKIWDFDRRARMLNRPAHLLSRGMHTIENSMMSRGRRRAWESGDLGSPAPFVSLDLSDPCRRALGAAWLFLLRMASVEAELLRMVGRYRENPAHPDFRLVYKRGRSCRYGAVYWKYRGSRLPRNETGSVALTEPRLRSLGIPPRERPGLQLQDRPLRRMVSLHKRYTKVVGLMKKAAGIALANVDLSVLDDDARGEAAI